MQNEKVIQTNFRLPVELKDWLQEQAHLARRTLTAELIVALEDYRAKKEREANAQGAAQ